MRTPTTEELQAIALLRELPIEEREIAAQGQRALLPPFHKLPVIHQVLFC